MKSESAESSPGIRDPRFVAVALQYEQLRRAAGQRQYEIARFGADGSLVRESPQLKQLFKVMEWVNEGGWLFGYDEEHWRGFFRYCFDALAPTIPQPGQLKNRVLLKQYMESAVTAPEFQMEQWLIDKYKRILIPEIATNYKIRERMGLV